MNKSDLISPGYVAINRQMHVDNADYGTGHFSDPAGVVQLAGLAGARTILDYGCGKGGLKPKVKALAPHLIVREYDPAVRGKDTLPSEADMVVCFDVLEHIEPDRLAAVTEHIASLAKVCAYVGVHNGAAGKTLSDGRNAHLTQQPPEWWTRQFEQRFVVKKVALFAEPADTEKVMHSMYVLGVKELRP